MRLVAMLERLRAALGGRPVAISSGYRCPAHNWAVGGAPESQCLLGNTATLSWPVSLQRRSRPPRRRWGSPEWGGTRSSPMWTCGMEILRDGDVMILVV